MVQTVFKYFNIVFTNQLLFLFIICGAFLLIFEEPSLNPKKFPTEKKIAKIGGIGYIIFGIGMYILNLFINLAI